MKTLKRVMLITTLMAAPAMFAHAAKAPATPEPAQDPIVQQLKLTDTQVAKIQSLHQKFINNVNSVPENDIKRGKLFDVIQSGTWDDAAVKKQLNAFSAVDQQIRYYKVKYYFDVAQVLTPEQRQQVLDDLAQEATE